MKSESEAPWAEVVPGAPFPMTSEELSRWPDDEWQYELIAGRLVRMSPTSDEHFYVMDNLHPVLRAFVKAHRLGIVTYPDTGFAVSMADGTETVFAPDIAFVAAGQVPPRRGKFLPVTPALAIEVASPSQYHPEMASKARLYLQLGVRLVWIVWPNTRAVDVWLPGEDTPTQTLGATDELDGLTVVPGFRLAVADLFA